MGSYFLDKIPGREDYFGESKYYSARFASSEDHSTPDIGEGKYYSPNFDASKEHFTLESQVPPKNSENPREDDHVHRAEYTGQASYSSPKINRENEEYYGSPQNASEIDALILFTSSYMEENQNRYFKKRYLVCNSCGGYYQLQEDEEPEDFSDECECGGNLELKTSKK